MAPAPRRSALGAPVRRPPDPSWCVRRTRPGSARRSRARPRNGRRSRRISGLESLPAPSASAAGRATAAASIRITGRSRPCTDRSGKRPGPSGALATARRRGCRRRPARARRRRGRAPSQRRQTARSRCNRLCRNAIGCSKRRARPRLPARRRLPRRSRPAATRVCRWRDRIETASHTSHTTRDRWHATTTTDPSHRSR